MPVYKDSVFWCDSTELLEKLENDEEFKTMFFKQLELVKSVVNIHKKKATKAKQPKKRKRCETPWSEYVAAIIFQHPYATYEQLDSLSLNISDSMTLSYKRDLEIRKETSVQKWFNRCKEKTTQWRTNCGIKDTDTIEVFLEGKSITSPRVAELIKGIDKKQKNKGDIFICVNEERWILISIKTTPDAPLSNWSIEKEIEERNPSLKSELKKHKEKLLKDNGIYRNWRENKKENRAKYNQIMYGGDNIYWSILKTWISENAQTEFRDIIASAAGSSITQFSTYKYDGRNFENLSDTFAKIKNNDITIIQDCPSNKETLQKHNLKQHYSDSSSKIWYYIQIGEQFVYRFEIRWKGDPFASPQFLLYTL